MNFVAAVALMMTQGVVDNAKSLLPRPVAPVTAAAPGACEAVCEDAACTTLRPLPRYCRRILR